jgi:hypothetical protein
VIVAVVFHRRRRRRGLGVMGVASRRAMIDRLYRLIMTLVVVMMLVISHRSICGAKTSEWR